MKRIIISSMIGNGFEWYDFAIYGQMAFLLGKLFFPSESLFAQSLATFAAFAVAFLFRPVGAILFGWIGDRYGRKNALLAAIIMMAIPTGLIGLLPTHAQIGILAPILLVLIRIFQGISLGGEFGGAITYIVEHSPGHQRGLLGSTSIFSLIIGFLMGTFVVIAIRASMSVEAFEAWGWRIPFLLGILIGGAGFLIRNKCKESPTYVLAKAEGRLVDNPLKKAVTAHRYDMLRAFWAYASVTMPFYLVAIYFINYTRQHLHFEVVDALWLNTASMLAMFLGAYLGAKTSDVVGRKRVMMPTLVLMAIAGIFSFSIMEPLNWTNALIAQCTLGLVVGMYLGPVPAFLVEVFPTCVRYTGMSLAFNGATVVFGGTAPMICLTLLAYTSNPMSIAAYLCLCNLISFLALVGYEDKWQKAL